MRLRFLGHAAFDVKLGPLRLCLDPHRPGALGGRFALPEIIGPFDALVHTHSHEDHAAWTPALGTTRRIDTDTDLDGLQLRFRAVPHDAVGGRRMGWSRMVSLRTSAGRVVHCGDIGAWNDDDLAWLGGCDVLLVPVGGTFTLDGPSAAALVEAVAPAMAVPIHAADPRIDLPLAPVDAFLAACPRPVVHLPHVDLADLARPHPADMPRAGVVALLNSP